MFRVDGYDLQTNFHLSAQWRQWRRVQPGASRRDVVTFVTRSQLGTQHRHSDSDLTFLFSQMAAVSVQAAKKYATLPPTVRTLASGVPTAPSLNLSARAHDGAHHAGRSDVPSKWAGGYQLSSSSLVNKSFATGLCALSHPQICVCVCVRVCSSAVPPQSQLRAPSSSSAPCISPRPVEMPPKSPT